MADSKHSLTSVFALILALGLVAAAFTLGAQLKNVRAPGTITVKGLAEKPVQANTANWKVGVYVWGKNYKGALDSGKREFEQLKRFIESQGFTTKDYRATNMEVDSYEQNYYDDKGNYRTRKNGYKAERSLVISSTDLDKVQQSLITIQNLRAENSKITFDEPEYLIDNLDSIKQELISAATQDAKRRADEFAKTSGASVGVMQSASQGSFNIYAANESSKDDSYGGTYDKDTIEKNVRLVVTIKYAID